MHHSNYFKPNLFTDQTNNSRKRKVENKPCMFFFYRFFGSYNRTTNATPPLNLTITKKTASVLILHFSVFRLTNYTILFCFYLWLQKPKINKIPQNCFQIFYSRNWITPQVQKYFEIGNVLSLFWLVIFIDFDFIPSEETVEW